MRFSVSAMLVAVLAGSAAPVQAAPVQAVNFTAAPNFASGGANSFTLGYQFTVGSQSVNATHLGYFDLGQNGLAGTATVGLWDNAGNLLATTTVTSANTLNGFFRYADIPDVLLQAGQTYRVGGVSDNAADGYAANTTGFTVDPRITFNGDRWTFNPGILTFPTNTSGVGNGWFGGNLMIDAVPEPATLAVFGVMAIGGGLYARRRKTAPVA